MALCSLHRVTASLSFESDGSLETLSDYEAKRALKESVTCPPQTSASTSLNSHSTRLYPERWQIDSDVQVKHEKLVQGTL